MAKVKQAKTESMLFAGFGGQGIMFMGKLFAQAALMAGYNVTWMPSYGAEVRGGCAYSMTKISDAEIASPIVTSPDILVVMNRPSFVKYAPIAKEKGVVIVNRSLSGDIEKRKNVKYLNIPMTEIAHKLGDARCANMVAAGAVVKNSSLLSQKEILDALKHLLREKDEAFTKNKEAFQKGFRW